MSAGGQTEFDRSGLLPNLAERGVRASRKQLSVCFDGRPVTVSIFFRDDFLPFSCSGCDQNWADSYQMCKRYIAGNEPGSLSPLP